MSRMPVASDDLIRVASLDDLKAKGMIVVAGEPCPLLVIYNQGRVVAVDNRCPHLGFPLHRGSVEDGILTCHWHHARFDLASGSTFDLWADDLPTAAVELRDGSVWVTRHTHHADGDAHWCNRLRAGMEQNIGLVVAKAVLGLTREGVDARSLIRDAALFGAHNRDGWGTGLTILTALGNLIPYLPEEERYLALYKGVRRVANDCEGVPPRRDRQPLSAGGHSLEALTRWFRHWVQVRHRDGAERTLLTAIASGVSPPGLGQLLLLGVTDRYFADGGHALDFINKAFECIDVIGWEHSAAVLPTVVDQLIKARGGEETSTWRQPVDVIELCEDTYRELPELIAKGAGYTDTWRSHVNLAEVMLADEPTGIVASLKSAIAAGARPVDLTRSLAYAAALRVARFGISNEFSDWETAHHCFTYCNALHQLVRRITEVPRVQATDPAVLRGIFHGAMQLYLIRFLNVPPAPLPNEPDRTLDELPSDPHEILAAFLAALDQQGSVRTAGRVVARYLALGHPAPRLIATLAQALLREDAGFHAFQMLEAGVRQYQEWGDATPGRHILIAVARYLAAHSPTERAELQTAIVARKLSRGRSLHEDIPQEQAL